MANIRLKELIEANIDPKLVARSKKTGKLVYFKTPQAKDAALKAGSHEDPKGKKGDTSKVDATPNDMFGGDYAKERGVETPKADPTAPVDGQTDDELYNAMYDMGYDFGELGSDDFDEDGFADAAMSLGYRWDDKNKVWNHRDSMGDEAPKTDTPKFNLPKKASKLNYKHAESLETAINAETGLQGVVDTDDNTDAIMFSASSGAMPTYTLYFGGNSDYGKPDEFRVSLEPTYANDPLNLQGKVDKTFKSGDEAMAFAIEVAKKYKKELEMDIDDDDEVTTDEPKVRPQSKVQDFVKNLSGKKYKEFAFDNDIDHRDAMEMQDFIQSLSDEEAEEILKKYGANESTKVPSSKLMTMIKR